jgi:hypothetical protein
MPNIHDLMNYSKRHLHNCQEIGMDNNLMNWLGGMVEVGQKIRQGT